MNKKIKNIIGVILGVIVFIGLSVLITSCVYDSICRNDQEIEEQYNEMVMKVDLIHQLPKDVIVENSGILLNKIDIKKVSYKIEDRGENIRFYYYVKEENTADKYYDADILLSSDFKILEEKYSHSKEEVKPFEEYKEMKKETDKRLSKLIGMAMAALSTAILIVIFYLIHDLYYYIKNIKNIK